MTGFLSAETLPPPMNHASGKRARKSDAVYQDLKRKILTGELTSDSPITEQALAQDYACSQSTIREALMLLQENGLVIRRGYQGTFVTDPTVLEAKLMLKQRLDIESTGIIEAAKLVTPRQIEDLRDLDHQCEACRERRDVFGFGEVDRFLHLKLFRIARMPVLEPVLVRTTMMLQRVMLPAPKPDAAWSRSNMTPHKAVLDALEARDTMGALNALQEHILSGAVLLAPHFYGSDLGKLQAEYSYEPVQAFGSVGL